MSNIPPPPPLPSSSLPSTAASSLSTSPPTPFTSAQSSELQTPASSPPTTSILTNVQHPSLVVTSDTPPQHQYQRDSVSREASEDPEDETITVTVQPSTSSVEYSAPRTPLNKAVFSLPSQSPSPVTPPISSVPERLLSRQRSTSVSIAAQQSHGQYSSRVLSETCPSASLAAVDNLGDQSRLRPSRSKDTVDSTSRGSDSGSNRSPPGVLKRVYNRIKIASLISHSKKSGPGREAEPDSNALLGDIHMKQVVRGPGASGISTVASSANMIPPVASTVHLPSLSGSPAKQSLLMPSGTGGKDRSSGKPPARGLSKVQGLHVTLPRSPTVASHMSTMPGAGDGCSGTTRSYTISRGNVHFWRSNTFEVEGRPFLKVNHDVNVDDVASIMHGVWKMKPPRIVTLIVSNVASLKDWSNVRQRLNFQKGLLKAARTTNMWIFTNGINIGASKVIGDAIFQEKKEKLNFHCHSSHMEQDYYYNPIPDSSTEPALHVIGIVREDLLRNADNLTDGDINVENLGNSLEEGKYDLNPDHTHYVVVRDKTVNKTGINLFASRIMQYLSTIGGVDTSEIPVNHDVPDLCSLVNMEIPVVAIVIQGGYDCARLVLDNLKKQFPVVVLRGSGGLADLLAYCYTELKQRSRETVGSLSWGSWDPEFVESYLKPELSNKIAHHFPKMRENALSRNMFRDRILECVRLAKQNNLTFMTILNMHNYSECQLENLSVYLLRALFKSKPRTSTVGPSGYMDVSRAQSDLEGVPITDERLLKELYLTLDWNCPDVARDEVLVRDPSYCSRLQKELFLSALLRSEREEFVDLFLSYGFRVHTFITPKRLLRLFKHIYHQEFFRTVCWEGVLGHSLISKPSKYFIDTDLNWLIETVTGLDNFVNSDHLYFNVMSMYVHNQASAERKALAILCLWGVFGNRDKLVKTLWKHSDQPIHLALIISMAYERLSWHVGDSSLKNDLKNHSKDFADMSIGVLDSCYSAATCRAFDVLSEEGPDWNYKTAVDIAANARTRSFLAHPCCQKWLTNTFLGEIRIRELSWGFFTVPAFVKILLCAFFIFPMFVWVRFKPKIISSRIGNPNVKGDGQTHEDQEDDIDMIDGDRMQEDTALLETPQAHQMTNNNILRKRSGSSGSKVSRGSVRDGSRKQSREFTKEKIMTEFSRRNSMRPDLYTSLLRDREVIIRSQPPLHRMIYYMWSAPITKFWTFQIFYICYLMIFSLAVLWPSCGNTYLDVIVCSWTVMIIIENIHRTYILYRKYTSVPLVFKCIEVLMLITFVVIYAATSIWNVTFFQPYTRKVILCFALIYFYYRLIAIYLPISPTLGPLLYRLKLMVTVDFMNFMRMALVLIISSGIVLQSVMYPDSDLNWSTFRQAFHRAWFTLFTTPTDDLFHQQECNSYRVEGNTCYAGMFDIRNHTGSPIKCPTTGFFPYFFTIQYFVLLKLVMVTLLYALFSSTASQLEVDSIWKYQRYILVVDFASRLPLPSPLSIFCYLFYICKWLIRLVSCRYTLQCYRWVKRRANGVQEYSGGRKRDTFDGSHHTESKYNMKMSEEDFNFWRHLAREYARKQLEKEEEADMQKKQFDTLQTVYEEIEYEKKLLRQLKGRIIEMERMMLTSHVHLENIKHLSTFNRRGDSDITTGVTGTQTSSVMLSPSVSRGIQSFSPHILSRQSPYPGTRVQRIPVPDKFVPWEVTWLDYDPVSYSKQKYDFPRASHPYVDEDLLLLQELHMDEVKSKLLPVFKWNTSSLNPAGITIDRQSWCQGSDGQSLIYKLDQGLPRNPFGRTGLKGRGGLPRFGPNHYIMMLITRWQRSVHVSTDSKLLEFIAERSSPIRWDQYSIPTKFIPGEKTLVDFQSLFSRGQQTTFTVGDGVTPASSMSVIGPTWNDSDVLMDFLKSCCIVDPTLGDSTETKGVSLERHLIGYFDDSLNTDHSWKEVELFHFHFNCNDNLFDRMDTNLVSWKVVSEDVFVKLPPGQSALLHELISKLKPTII